MTNPDGARGCGVLSCPKRSKHRQSHAQRVNRDAPMAWLGAKTTLQLPNLKSLRLRLSEADSTLSDRTPPCVVTALRDLLGTLTTRNGPTLSFFPYTHFRSSSVLIASYAFLSPVQALETIIPFRVELDWRARPPTSSFLSSGIVSIW